MSNETLKNDAKEICRIAGTAAGGIGGMATAAVIVSTLPITGLALSAIAIPALGAGLYLGAKEGYKSPGSGILRFLSNMG